MGWLVSYTLASMAAAFIVVKLFDLIKDYLFAGATSGVVNTARAGLFVGTWTAVTARAGMSGFSKRVRRLRLSKIFGKKEGEIWPR